MTKKTNTKKALLSSALSFVLCLTMLIGTTFAWFTDSVTSANNIIKSGNLDVELYYKNDTMTDWTKVTSDTNVFKQDTLWEPGHTEVIKLKVANEGTLALKYQLGINIASEVGSVNKAGAEFKLSDYIYFGVADGDNNYDRASAIAAVKDDAVQIKTGITKEESLQAKEDGTFSSKEMTMVVYMPETVGNEANYATGEAVPTINLGLNLYATQFTKEADSFDENYDLQAWTDVTAPITPDANGVVNVYTAEQLSSIGITDGIKVVNIMADIDLAGRLWTPLKVNNDAYDTLTINGNGYQIKNMTIVETTKGSSQATYGTGFIGNAYAGSVVINELTFVDSSVTGKGDYVGTVVGYAYYADVVLNDVDVVNGYVTSAQWNAKSLGGMIGNKHMINGSGAATADGFHMIDCDVIDSQIIGYSMVAGLVGAIPYCDKMTDDTFQDCSISGTHVIAYYGMPMELLAVNTVLPVSDDDFTITDSIVAPRIGSSNTTTSNAQLKDSIENYDVVYLGKDYTFELNGAQRNGVTLIGLGNTKLANNTNYAGNGTLGAIWKNMTFENLTFTTKIYTMDDGATSVFKDCVFEQGIRGAYSSGTGVVFEGCEFYDNSEGFAMHFATVKTVVTVKNCDFIEGTIAFGNGSGSNVYSDALVTFENCTFSGESTRTEYVDAWASCKFIDCIFAEGTEVWLQQSEAGESVTLENTMVTVVEK